MTDEELLNIQSQVIESICRFTRRAYEDIEEEIDPLVKIIEQQRQEIERLNAALQKKIKDFSNLQRREGEVRLHWIKENARLQEENERLKAANEGLNDEFHIMMKTK